jgi:hypothetical protein
MQMDLGRTEAKLSAGTLEKYHIGWGLEEPPQQKCWKSIHGQSTKGFH